MARIALFGGSFNPPHQGHLDVMRWLVTGDCRPLDFDDVWMLPTVTHAFNKGLEPYEVRERMVKAMLDKEFPSYVRRRRLLPVVRREEQYTVDTLEVLHGEYPDTEFVLVVGADILNETDKWERWGDVQKLATILPVARVGTTPPEGWEVHPIHAADPSSTDIRERLSRSDLTYLLGPGADVPAAVMKIIEAEGLYGYEAPDFGPQQISLDTVFFPTSAFKDYQPGQVFGLTGNIRRVLGVRSQDHTLEGDDEPTPCFAFKVLRDSHVAKDNHQDVRRWLGQETEYRHRESEFDQPRPKPRGPNMCFLLDGGEPQEARPPGDLLGEADGHVFFLTESSGDLFGDLFGGLF